MNGMTLTIKGLFGHFNYEIPLYGLESVDGIPMSDGVTILTGANGYGKSTILRALEAISKGDIEFFANLKFEELALHTEEGKEELSIQKQDYWLIINHETENQILVDEVKSYMSFMLQPSSNVNLEQSDLGSSSQVVFGDISNSQITLKVNMESAFETMPLSVNTTTQKGVGLSERQKAKFARIYDFMTKSVSKTFMIREQRLIEKTSVGIRDVVKDIPHKLQTRFFEASNQYSEISTQLDSSFPYRLLQQSADANLTQGEFDQLYRNMNDKLRVLQENGFPEFLQQDIPVFQADKAGILRIFFDDFDAKYQKYEPLIAKLTLFRKILDRRFRTFKRVEVSRKSGLRVLDIPTDNNDEEVEIPPEKLSSGEQETLVLYYQLIFETAPGTMLLIDEPEISLHIAWQRHFIDELKEIVRLNDLRAVVATHSVSILNGNWDIEVNLEALHKDEVEA